MALSAAEKSRRYRERKAARATVTGDIPFDHTAAAALATAVATATAIDTVTDTVTDDVPFNTVTVTGKSPGNRVTDPVTVTAEDQFEVTIPVTVTEAVTAVVTNFAQQQRRWISEVTDRVAVIEALLLEVTQTVNKLRLDIQTLVTVTTPKTVVTDVTGRTPIPEPPPEPPVTKPERPPSKLLEPGFRPLGSVLPTSLKNIPVPPLNNPRGKAPDDV